MGQVIKIKITVSTNLIGCTTEGVIEIDNEDIVGLSDEDATDFINERVVDEILGNELINWTWEVVDHV